MDILEVLERGTRRVEELDDVDLLRGAARMFLSAYSEYDGYGVVAASPQAERVLGAAMMLNPRLSGRDTGRTVILDVNIASGTLMARAARRLRDSGNNDQLVGVVLHSLVESYEGWHVPELGELVVVSSKSASSALRERAERRGNCIALAV